MKKKYIYIITLFFIIYICFVIAGLNGYGVIKVYTEKTEFGIGEDIKVYTKNIGLTPLYGSPNWWVYKINDTNETLVKQVTIKGMQTIPPQGYFGENGVWVWNPQSPGRYRIFVFITPTPSHELTGQSPSAYTIITVR